jgi:creatinine amidohydrolase
MRPEAIRTAREACPVVYVPLGTLEWHGLHNPVGLDALKMHQLCIRCAQSGGGLVFPPLYYGEAREEGLIDSSPQWRDQVSGVMGLPPKNFEPGYMRRDPWETVTSYQQLLLHIMNQAQSLGFSVIVFGAGHYPLIDHARAAASLFHQQRWSGQRRENQPIPWVFIGCELVQDLYPEAGDHAGYWETSLMMALEPGLVDLDALPSDPSEHLVGVISTKPVRDSNADFGEVAVSRIVGRVVAEVRDRLENRAKYLQHGLIL